MKKFLLKYYKSRTKGVIKILVFFLVSLTLLSCQSEEYKREKWLETNLLKYLNQSNFEIRNEIQREIFSPQYLEYKLDAINVNFDVGMSEEEFRKKWEGIFDTRYAGIDAGLIVCGQDWSDNIKLKISFKEKINDAYFYNFIFVDNNDECPPTIIKVISKNDSYQITDILEGILISKTF